ncbi:hypothetical protein [Citrobacter murliniae]
MKCKIVTTMTLAMLLFTSTTAHAALNQQDQLSALETAEKIYDAMLGSGAAADARWETPEQLKDINDPVIPGNKLHVLEYTVMDPANGAYQRIHVLVNVDGGVAGAEIIYAGR